MPLDTRPDPSKDEPTVEIICPQCGLIGIYAADDPNPICPTCETRLKYQKKGRPVRRHGCGREETDWP